MEDMVLGRFRKIEMSLVAEVAIGTMVHDGGGKIMDSMGTLIVFRYEVGPFL